MASEGPNSPGTMANDTTVGDTAWINPDNAKVSDNTYTTAFMGQYTGGIYESVKIVKSDGSIGTTDKANNNWTSSDAYTSYGSSSDLWGETWTREDINSSNFGVVIQAYIDSDSYYLKATNFGFTIPEGMNIDGIVVEIEKKEVSSGSPNFYDYAYIDHIRITVYYTEAPTAINPKVKTSGTFSTKTIKTKIGGTFVEKPQMVKVDGAFI